jgi:hypothetical protein
MKEKEEIPRLKMNWIKCTKKLPKNQEECLVAFHIIPGDSECSYCFNLAIFNGTEFLSWELVSQINYVTHWMKLPDQPE